LPYKSIFTKSFTRELKKLPSNTKGRIVEAVEKAVANPYAGTRLRGELEGLWRWRIGKYRVIYMINEREKTVVFVDVGLRKAIYR